MSTRPITISAMTEHEQFMAGTLTCQNAVLVDGEALSCDSLAMVRMAGERDSFGTEWLYFCDPCADEVRAEIAAEEQAEAKAHLNGKCGYCGRTGTGDVKAFRDPDSQPYEGPGWACKRCRDRMNAQLDAELAYYEQEAANRACSVPGCRGDYIDSCDCGMRYCLSHSMSLMNHNATACKGCPA